MLSDYLTEDEIQDFKKIILRVLNRKHLESGKVPIADSRSFDSFSIVVSSIFGNWNNAIRELGLKPNFERNKWNDFKNYSDDYILHLLSDKFKELGSTSYDYYKSNRGNLPSPQVICKRFGLKWVDIVKMVKKND